MVPETAETIALQALAFIAADEAVLSEFLSVTGLGPAAVRNAASAPEFLAGVIDFLLADEARVLAFCAATDIPAEWPQRARMLLPGADVWIDP